jgi:hypothetical protein
VFADGLTVCITANLAGAVDSNEPPFVHQPSIFLAFWFLLLLQTFDPD